MHLRVIGGVRPAQVALAIPVHARNVRLRQRAPRDAQVRNVAVEERRRVGAEVRAWRGDELAAVRAVHPHTAAARGHGCVCAVRHALAGWSWGTTQPQTMQGLSTLVSMSVVSRDAKYDRLPRQARDETTKAPATASQQTEHTAPRFRLLFLSFFLRRVLLGSAVAMGGLRLALEKLRRPPRPHQQVEV
eukprot:COSAG06_NODE_790_length_12278_cov_52.245176_9_plen_189_part_00